MPPLLTLVNCIPNSVLVIALYSSLFENGDSIKGVRRDTKDTDTSSPSGLCDFKQVTRLLQDFCTEHVVNDSSEFYKH